MSIEQLPFSLKGFLAYLHDDLRLKHGSIKQMIDHDRLFKELLSTFFWEFVELFLPKVAAYLERDSIFFLNQEVFTDVTSGERREVDL
ncbi:MAG: hypothetical protein U7123_08735 [Potamolinea sp.]